MPSEGVAVGHADFELTHYQVGVIDLILHDWAEGTDLYKRAGETTDPVEVADHDGPAIVGGYFKRLDQDDDGVIVGYHPHAGRDGFHAPDDRLDEPAILLVEVDRAH